MRHGHSHRLDEIFLGLTLSRTRAPAAQSGRERSKFVIYSVIGWGTPLFLTLTVVTLMLTLDPMSPYNPGLGSGACWLRSFGNLETYLLTTPISIILLINAVIFILLVGKLVIAKLETKNVRLSTQQNQSNDGNTSAADILEQMVDIIYHFRKIQSINLVFYINNIEESVLLTIQFLD